jgi:hypothetical protein
MKQVKNKIKLRTKIKEEGNEIKQIINIPFTVTNVMHL